jgi:hypothetical protein
MRAINEAHGVLGPATTDPAKKGLALASPPGSGCWSSLSGSVSLGKKNQSRKGTLVTRDRRAVS